VKGWVLPRGTRRGVVCFEFYMTRRFRSRFFVVFVVGIIEISFSGAIE
jgi:hypothetical protein